MVKRNGDYRLYKTKKYEKKKTYWRDAIYNGGVKYSWSDGIWGPVPAEAYTYFSHEELSEIYAELERDEEKLRNLLDQME